MGRTPQLEELLQPSLQEGQLLKPPYSVRSGFFVAFFGGVLAAVAFAALNSKRTERLRRDAVWLALLAGAAVAYGIWSGYAAQTDTVPSWISALGGKREGMRLLGRAAGILGFGVTYLFQRDMHETRDLRGQEPPSAWLPGIVTILLAAGVGFVLVGVGVALGRS
jgi:hypothetical protein